MKQYENYKDSGIEYIGKIPEHWEVKKLKFCFNFATGFTPSTGNSEYYIDGDNIWITIADMQDKIIKDSNQKITDFAIEQNKAQIIPKGALLYSFKLSVGKVAFTGIDCYTNEAIFSVLPSNDVNLGFYYYSLPEQVIKNANENIYGAKLLNQDLIKNAIIVVPKADEQVVIADFLDRKTAEIDKIIANKQKLIALYEEEKQAIINQAVTKGIDPNVKMKDSGVEWLGEIPEHWEVKRFNYLFSFSRGLSITKENLKDNGIPCINYGEIHSKYGFEINPENIFLKCVDIEYLQTSEKSLLKKGDFIFADTSEDIKGSGNFTYLNSNTPVFGGYHTVIAIPKLDFITRFIAYFFNSTHYRNQIRSCVTGTKVYSITQSILKNTNIILPPSQEQYLIVEYIDKEFLRLNTIIEKFNKQIELLQEYRTTLISEVVTGKVKVN